MIRCAKDEADLFVQGLPMSLEAVPEYFLAKNMQAWGAPVTLPGGETWDTVAETLAVRFGQHIWHPSHWEQEHTAMDKVSREEAQAHQAELLAEAIEADEQDGGCSRYRSFAYQAAFAACLALFHAEGADVFLEDFTDHLNHEIGRVLRQEGKEAVG